MIRLVAGEVPGVLSIVGDVAARSVTVEYDSQTTDLTAIKRACHDVGYPVKE